MRFVLENVAWITLRVICWELECASRTDGGHQQLPDLTTLPGIEQRQ